MDALASNATVKSNAFADKFLYMIRTRMLIIESLKDDGTKNGRASAGNISGDLDNLREKYLQKLESY